MKPPISEWATLKTKESNVFCVIIHEFLNEPIYSKRRKNYSLKSLPKRGFKRDSYRYLPSFDSILIRDYQQKKIILFVCHKKTKHFSGR